MTELTEFVRESNKIEGILRDPYHHEVEALEGFLGLAEPSVEDMRQFVAVMQPNAVIRDKPHLNVRVGNHIAPPGGPRIVIALEGILGLARTDHAYRTHHDYETLHPFTDGNGRSGRALWLWGMQRQGALGRALGLGFLHTWYYQSLEAGRG